MFPERFTTQESIMEMPDYRARLEAMATEESLPEDTISDEDFDFAAKLLEETWQAHGNPDKPSYKHYHNGEHPLDVIGRSWKIWKVCREVLPRQFGKEGFKHAMFAGAIHERFKTAGSTGVDEKQSAEWGWSKMQAAGYSLNACRQVSDAVIATTAIKVNGSVVQPLLRQGSRDPLKWTVALADTGGVFMEGVSALGDNSLDLYLEDNDIAVENALESCDPDEIVKSLQYEDRYMRERMAAFREDLRYYFPDEEDRRLLIEASQAFAAPAADSRRVSKLLAESTALTRKIVLASLAPAREATTHGLGRISTAKNHITTQLKELSKK